MEIETVAQLRRSPQASHRESKSNAPEADGVGGRVVADSQGAL